MNDYIIVDLDKYMQANNGKIKPEQEVQFTFYEQGVMRGFLGAASHYQSCWTDTVTRVRKHPKGYSGTNKKGKRLVVPEMNASIQLPISILAASPQH